MKPTETYPTSPKALQEKQRSGTLNIETLKTIVPCAAISKTTSAGFQGYAYFVCPYTIHIIM